MKCKTEAGWDLTLTLIRPLGCACKGAHCLAAFCLSKRESGQGLSLASVEDNRGERDRTSEGETR